MESFSGPMKYFARAARGGCVDWQFNNDVEDTSQRVVYTRQRHECGRPADRDQLLRLTTSFGHQVEPSGAADDLESD